MEKVSLVSDIGYDRMELFCTYKNENNLQSLKVCISKKN